jgi:hypothetical protein
MCPESLSESLINSFLATSISKEGLGGKIFHLCTQALKKSLSSWLFGKENKTYTRLENKGNPYP